MSIGVALVGFSVGVLIGLTGVGGGVLMTPILVLLGTPPILAVGTDLVYGAITKAVGSWVHLRQGTVHAGVTLAMAAGSVPAAVVGTLLVHTLAAAGAEVTVKRLLGAVLILAALASLLRSPLTRRYRPSLDLSRHRGALAALGAVIGLLVGMTSVGSGSLIAVALLTLTRLSARQVVGSDIAHAFLLTAAAGLAHWRLGSVDLRLAANLLVGSLPGVLLGARLVPVSPVKPLRVAVAVMVMASGVNLLNP